MTDDFFRARLDQMMDLKLLLVVLGNRMPWSQMEGALAYAFERKDRAECVVSDTDFFGTTLEIAGGGKSAAGRMRLPIRLMAGYNLQWLLRAIIRLGLRALLVRLNFLILPTQFLSIFPVPALQPATSTSVRSPFRGV